MSDIKYLDFVDLYNFRGKSKENGDWFYGHLSIYKQYSKKEKQDIAVCYIGGGGYLKEGRVLTETVGQYTRIKDTHNVKIFEGDIVAISEDEIGVIKYIDGAFCICGDGWIADFCNNYRGCDVEVIGNVHDDPELVVGEQ